MEQEQAQMKPMIWVYNNSTIRLTKEQGITAAVSGLNTKACIVIKNSERCSITEVSQNTDYNFIAAEVAWVESADIPDTEVQPATLDIVAQRDNMTGYPLSTSLAISHLNTKHRGIRTSKGNTYETTGLDAVLLGIGPVRSNPAASEAIIRIRKPVLIVRPEGWSYNKCDYQQLLAIANKEPTALKYDLILSKVSNLGKKLEDLLSNLFISRLPKLIFSPNDKYLSNESLLDIPAHVRELLYAKPEEFDSCLRNFQPPALMPGQSIEGYKRNLQRQIANIHLTARNLEIKL